MELPPHYTVGWVSSAIAGKRASLKITLQEYQSAYDKSAEVRYVKTMFFGLYKRVDPTDTFMFNYWELMELGGLKAEIKRMDNTILVLSNLPKDAKVKLTGDEETLVEPQVNYNDGNWHRWDGATECPVHNKSVVEYVWHDEIGTSGVLNRVSGWDGSDVKVAWERVIKFRVTKEYVAPPVEPREFWIMYSKIMQPRIESHKPLDTTGYIHVKEVTNA